MQPGAIEKALENTLKGTDFEAIGPKYEGKVRDTYLSNKTGSRLLVTTDRISAFDRVLGTIPFKGQVLTKLAAWWFEQTKNVVPNHLLSVPDPNALECVDCEPLLVEMVVRAYVTGSTSTSIWTHYEKGERVFCGHTLPEGLKKNQKLPKPILTPATKAPKGEHDVSGSREEILATGHVKAEDFDAAAALVMKLFEAGQKICAAQGLVLVDTKYELGKTKDGKIVVIDEIHTPDSSRFWMASSYDQRFAAGQEPESFDKDFVRNWYTARGYRGDGAPPTMPDDLRAGAAERYIAAFEKITGTTFVPNEEEPVARLTKNLAPFSG
ncbi:MAG TPA: phosphoribosylaminoimidazolesuccinocarboxamide synthase [Polyangiaceae bacterium]